jgi:hypothetical protein
MPLLGASQEVAKKDAKTFPLGSPLALPLYKAEQEKNIKVFYALLAGRHHERQIWKANLLQQF